MGFCTSPECSSSGRYLQHLERREAAPVRCGAAQSSMMSTGFLAVLTSPVTILLIFLGVGVGIVFGSIPGLTATMAVTIFLPLTYTMSPVMAISLLMGLYIGGIFGGLISAILLNIPGTPSSIATCFDGTPMRKNGEAAKALGAGITFSFLGTLFGLLVMIFIAPLLARAALLFGPFEYCALAVFSLSLVIMLTGKDLTKGLISALAGVMLATAGLAPIDSAKRFTFGNAQMNAGFQLLPILIGLYAISEIIQAAEEVHFPQPQMYGGKIRIKGLGFRLKEFIGQWKNFLYSALIGTGIGILPGIGGGTSGMLAYTFVKNRSKYPEKFGTGIIDGIVASETSNNACIGGAMIPLLTLGIPGDGTTAILLGALAIHNVAAGPLIFSKSGDVVYAIYMAMIIASIAMFLLELFGIRIFINILKAPKYLLLPVVIVLCFVGAFGSGNRMFDVYCALAFGFAGYLLQRTGMPLPPVVLGFILGPLFEANLRRVSQYLTIDPMSFTMHPIALVLLAVTVILLVLSLRRMKMEEKIETGSGINGNSE